MLGRLSLWQPVPDGAQEILKDSECPKCGQPHTHRSRSKGTLERALIYFTPYRPFRCSDCRWRGWRVPSASPPAGISR